MNVRLASQLLSESVACSLEFCLKEGFTEFQGCDATMKFLRIFNKLFDILNSRNLRASNWKCPMQDKNKLIYSDFLNEARTYILSLKQIHSNTPLVKSNRKTGFLGFLICIKSLLEIYDHLIISQHFDMSFLLSYKFSQDHLELFFGKIRQLGGSNNNLTARQFKSAYKKLLVKNDVQEVSGGNYSFAISFSYE